MAKGAPAGYPRINPYLYYEDVAGALEWLQKAFGFTEKVRMDMPDGSIAHAEIELDGGVIMLGRPSDDYRNPKNAGAVTQSLYVYVEDVDAHFAQAKAAGAEIISEPADQFYGDRNYNVADPEGHQWSFGTNVRTPTPEEMAEAMKQMAEGGS